MNEHDTSRRHFLRAAGGTLGAAWIGAHWPEFVAAAEHAHAMADGSTDRSLRLLSAGQARDVEAIAAQIVPSGDTPGAREAGVVYFIDHVYTGPYAGAAAEFVAGLSAFQAEFARQHPAGGQFADLDAANQHSHLRSVEQTPFFGQMKFLTVLGLLALPSYGGNRDKVGWRLVGFVDRHAWEPPFGHYDAGYRGFEPYAKERQS